MAAIAFDTLKFVRRLKEAGVPETQAEAQAELMAEAFVYNMDSLVTKDHLEGALDARFAAQDLRFENRVSDLYLRMADIRGELKLQRWILAAIAASTVIPALMTLFAP
ncbi:DUF1640 domain-containing protein [Pseudohalioglobus sediminis]|uniref:DUF1640 domain-containing protein n=1 Tax=Pseudohalioglobus sediminis TaxID=2606449 RepID=A0A5B0WPT7_9GAMM|nr:DUF1640 domain-containing protein [Pseudohalioglobus sediminis]KAA1188953.1 DUF1640 domain-containing protein [Pseudohalioglobus sediminis]